MLACRIVGKIFFILCIHLSDFCEAFGIALTNSSLGSSLIIFFLFFIFLFLDQNNGPPITMMCYIFSKILTTGPRLTHSLGGSPGPKVFPQRQNFHRLHINVCSCLQENLLCYCWQTHSSTLGVI